jgi:signal transduction histidine kinase
VVTPPCPRSTRARCTLAAAALSLVTLTIMGACLDLVIRRWIEAGIFKETERAAVQWAASGAREIPAFTRVNRFHLVNSHGRVIHASAPVSGMAPLSTVRPPPHKRIRHVIECPPRGDCVMVTAVRVTREEARRFRHRDPHVLYAGMKQPSILARFHLELLIAAGVLSLALLMTWKTWFMAGRILRPVEALWRPAHLAPHLPGRPTRRCAYEDEWAQHVAMLREEVQLQRRFASEASHELKNPVAGLRARLEEVLAHPGDVDPLAAIRGALSVTDRLEAIINDLSEVTRLHARCSAATEQVNLGSLVARAAATRHRDGASIQVHVAGDLWVRGHRMQLIRALDNLLDNAQRHAESVIEVTVEREGDQAVVTVTDDGPGIPPQDRERVFERFTRLENGRHRDPSGSGLGLAIAREIAHAHDGTLTIEDSPNGARLALRLPLFHAD